MIHIPPEMLASVRATSDRHDAAATTQQSLAVLKLADQPKGIEFNDVIERAEDVKVDHLHAATQLFEDYFAEDEYLDWTDFFDKLASAHCLYVATDDCPAAIKLQRHIRQVRDAH